MEAILPPSRIHQRCGIHYSMRFESGNNFDASDKISVTYCASASVN